jgi:hypothetical protein
LLFGQTVQCNAGYVPRQAYQGDQVCVTPETHAQVVADNRAAASRRTSPNSDTCIAGYVWRQAISYDDVCVSPKIRAQTAEDNLVSASRIATRPAQLSVANVSGQPIRGFQVASSPSPRIATKPRTQHPVPPPLNSEQLRNLVSTLGIHLSSINPVTSQISASNSPIQTLTPGNAIEYTMSGDYPFGALFQTAVPQEMSFEGAGEAEIDFGAIPGKQYLLDCSGDSDPSLRAQSWYTLASGDAVAVLNGSSTGSNGHMVVPFLPAPATTQGASVLFLFNGYMNLFGCQVDVIAQ